MNDVYVFVIQLEKDDNKPWIMASEYFQSKVDTVLNNAELPYINWGWREHDLQHGEFYIRFPSRDAAQEMMVLTASQQFNDQPSAKLMLGEYPGIREKILGYWENSGMQEGK
jgi:hypothetical protein